MQASCISAAPSQRLFQRFNLNTWVLPCVGVFACFLDLNSAWSVNRIVHWLMTLIMAEIIFLLVLSKFFLDSALMWGLRVDHSTLRKAKCSKDFLKDCPGPVELYLIFFLYVACFWKYLWISNVSKLNDALILYKKQCGLVVKNVDSHPGLVGINWPLLGIWLRALCISVFWKMKMRMIYSNHLVGFLGKLSDWIHLKP